MARSDISPAMQDQVFSNLDEKIPTTPQNAQPKEQLYQVIGDQRIGVSRAMGPMWKRNIEAAIRTYSLIHKDWETCYAYFNFKHNEGTLDTSRGTFKRGDNSENIVYANLQTVLPAIYTKNPDITVNTGDDADASFSEALKKLLNTLIRKISAPGINLKPKMKRAALFAELTNMGPIKLEWTLKEDSREVAVEELQSLFQELESATDPKEIQEVYGKLQALEMQIAVREQGGPKAYNVLPHNLIIDPFAEQNDGCDGNWMAERVWFPTEYLKARYTKKEDKGYAFVFKPTHMADLQSSANTTKMDGLSTVLQSINHDPDKPESFTDPDRLAYLQAYLTECYYVWDKTTRRVYLYLRDDMTWPLWVWEDPFKLSRFFPYFFVQFTQPLGGTVSSGQTSYYLDQQDTINDTNRQVARIRRSVFHYFFYNVNKIDKPTAEKLVKALRGEATENVPPVGIALDPEVKFKDVFEALVPPSAEYEPLFDKKNEYSAIDRLGGVSDALRGAQFKTNTNQDAVQAYQDAVRLRIGAKIDCIEETTEALVWSLAEMLIQFADQQFVDGIIGQANAVGWQQMDVQSFNSTYSCEVIAGSIEKPTSAFKKKEAVQVAQALGQFANAAPGAVLKVMLRVLEQAFTEVVIKKEDWDSIDQEIAAGQQKGVSTGVMPNGAAAPGGGQPGQPAQPGQSQSGIDIPGILQKLPTDVKARIIQMSKAGAPEQEIVGILKQAIAGITGSHPDNTPQSTTQQPPIAPAQGGPHG